MLRNVVTIKVPASTSNLGSGFDTLGLALRLYNTVRVRRLSGQRIAVVLPLSGIDTATAEQMIIEAVRLFFRRTRQTRFGIEVALAGDVPVARGLGASATARVGVIAALNVLTQARLSRQRLLELATELEGHPDNASPAILGGFTVSGQVGNTVRCLRFPVDRRLKFVTLIPRFSVRTDEARQLMPASYSRADTAHGLNRAALISAAVASRDYTALRGLFDDRMHQPFREPLVPRLPQVIRAGERRGALGGFLSGSGSAIICLALGHAAAVAEAMQRALPDSEVKILSADNEGFVIGKKAADARPPLRVSCSDKVMSLPSQQCR